MASTVAQVPGDHLIAATGLSTEEGRAARRELRRRKMLAVAFVAPLIAFLFFAFVAPIATMLFRSVYNPTVAELIPDTLATLDDWDGESTPDSSVLTALAVELNRLALDRSSGKLAESLNSAHAGAASLVNSTARRLRRADASELSERGAQLLLAADERWADPDLWRAIRQEGEVFSANFYLTALDLERSPGGGIQARESAQIYIKLYAKTLRIALTITVICVLLGYPLAYYLATAPARTANLLMVLVLLPFWTSFLVRTTAWIALLQTNGVINASLMGLGITNDPIEMLYTQFATVVAMTHILLPFMILPLYSVMRGIDPGYMRAAQSLGARPIPAFIRIYLPLTMPGLTAGCLLVFIISVGYYIIPALVGGTDGQMISNIIAFHMQRSNNWELAAALGSLLLLFIVVLYWLFDWFFGSENIKLG